MEFIGGATGVLIIGLTNYTTTVERQREYGILKAIGMKNSSLMKSALLQSILLALSSFLIAAGLTVVAIKGLQYAVNYPLAIIYDTNSVATVLVVALLMGVIAALLPASRISRIDPAIAFK